MILNQIFPLFAIFALGFLLKHFGVFNKKDSQSIARLLIQIMVPFLVFKIVSAIELKTDFLLLPLAAMVYNVAMLVLVCCIANVKKFSAKHKGSWLLLFPSFEVGTVGYILALPLLGEIGLSHMVFFDLGNGIFLFTVLYAIASLFHPQAKEVKSSLQKFIRTPCSGLLP